MFLEQRSWSIDDLDKYYSEGFSCECDADKQTIKIQEEYKQTTIYDYLESYGG